MCFHQYTFSTFFITFLKLLSYAEARRRRNELQYRKKKTCSYCLLTDDSAFLNLKFIGYHHGHMLKFMITKKKIVILKFYKENISF